MYLIGRPLLTLNSRRRAWASAALLLLLPAGGRLHAQIQSPPQGAATRPLQLPLSGRQASGGAMVQQSATPPPGSSVNTIDQQIQIQGGYQGSVPATETFAGTIQLTLAEAVQRGLRTNLGVLTAGDSSDEARSQRLQARSSLLPTINASASENAAKVNLAAEGFSASAFGTSLPFQFPTTVGPFHYYDVHAAVQQNLLDMTAVHNLRSANQSAAAALLDAKQAREEVVLAVTATYLQLMATSALVNEQQAEVQYARASYEQARAQADAGNKAPIEANRSLVELQTEEQRLRGQIGDLEKQKNQLARLIGLPLGFDIELKENLSPLAADDLPVRDEIAHAWAQRQDLISAEAQLKAAQEARKAASAERLPYASLNGTYGLQGVNPDQGASVFQASATVTLPIFQGGRIAADTAQADAVVAQRRAELEDERGAVELDVRNAHIDLDVANQQVDTAANNQKLALETLRQSQDRFAVGVADSVEVVNSQEALAAADHDYISSLFSQYLARITLAHAMGEAEKDLPELFKRNH